MTGREAWQAARRFAAAWWPTAVAAFALAFAPRTANPLWTVMQAVSAVVLAFALRQFARHVALRAARFLDVRFRVLHRSGRPAGAISAPDERTSS